MCPVEECERLIDRASDLFSRIPAGRDMLPQLAQLKVKLHHSCVLAIAGKVKAGKSSLLNALIGEDLAKVGDLETTATINKFCYGHPADADRPLKVVWDDGHETYETIEFMDSLQGHDDETLRRAAGIAYLEYYIDNPLLKELTIVDTPGTGAVVEEHQEIAEKFFKLRDKHRRQSVECTDSADAVVYLLGAVANANDKKFLDDFREITRDSNNINSIGILSKVDVDARLMAARHEQARYLSGSLKSQLNTVVPVSAGLHKAVRECAGEFAGWQTLLKQVPAKEFALMMMSVKMYSMPTHKTLTAQQRMEMKGNLPWSIFRTIATELYAADTPEQAVSRLNDIANIDGVKRLIREYFFDRSKNIRCSRVLDALLGMTAKVLHIGMFRLEEEVERTSRWVSFVRDHANDPRAAGLIEHLSKEAMSPEEFDCLKHSIIKEVKAPAELLQTRFLDDDLSYAMLKALQAAREDFNPEEYDELSALFSKKNNSANPDERAMYWNAMAMMLNSGSKREIARNAAYLYSKRQTYEYD